jgi:mannose-6-phosphate isomerase-like protein (cupin superfamily)
MVSAAGCAPGSALLESEGAGSDMRMDAVETVTAEGAVLALIVRGTINVPGVSFFTPNDYSQQLAYMQHPAGRQIVPHVHKPVQRAVTRTLEVLFVRKGRLRVDFYTDARVYVESRVLAGGDTILLVAGGHGFEVLEAVEMFEVKQGPYAGDADKERIAGIDAAAVRIAGGGA